MSSPLIFVYDRPPPEDYSNLLYGDFVTEAGLNGRRRFNGSTMSGRWQSRAIRSTRLVTLSSRAYCMTNCIVRLIHLKQSYFYSPSSVCSSRIRAICRHLADSTLIEGWLKTHAQVHRPASVVRFTDTCMLQAAILRCSI